VHAACNGLQRAESSFDALVERHRLSVDLIRTLTAEGADRNELEIDALILEADSILQKMRELARPYQELAKEREQNA
jgi:hypothetical protein